MPVLWESSDKPMYIKTVWINGLRHAILSEDDPYFRLSRKKKRPKTLFTLKSTNLQRFDKTPINLKDTNFEIHFKRLNLLLKEKDQTELASDIISENDTEVNAIDLSDISTETESEFILKASAQPIYENDTTRSRNKSSTCEMRLPKHQLQTGTEEKENNDLSERVLQWLDLAGKIDLLAPEDNSTRIIQQRHSYPDIKKRNFIYLKPKTGLDDTVTKLDHKNDTARTTSGENNSYLRLDDCPKQNKLTVRICDDNKKIDAGSKDARLTNKNDSEFQEIDRTNTHNPNEKYPRQSREQTTRNLEKLYRMKPKITNNPAKIKIDAQRRQKQENIVTRQKVASEIELVEKEYHELVGKTLMSDKFGAKRQVHIFMPAIPKKVQVETMSKTESLLNIKSKRLTEINTK